MVGDLCSRVGENREIREAKPRNSPKDCLANLSRDVNVRTRARVADIAESGNAEGKWSVRLAYTVRSQAVEYASG